MIKSGTYAEARLEYFKAQKARWERSLDYWVQVSASKKRLKVDHPQFYVEDKCAECGERINFYEDAIRAFGGNGNDLTTC